MYAINTSVFLSAKNVKIYFNTVDLEMIELKAWFEAN